jgi:stage V sporulation protein G
MEITEVRVKLMENADDRLQAFCSITFDHAFVVRDLKIIEGTNGPFVAMPSRKLTLHCHHCGAKNHLRAGYCNQCGTRQRDVPVPRDLDGRARLYADIAHPINSACREMIQARVIAEYQLERERSRQPGYVSRYDEDYGFDAGEDFDTSDTPRDSAPRVDEAHDHSGVRPPHLNAATRSDVPRTPHQKPPRPKSEFGAGILPQEREQPGAD